MHREPNICWSVLPLLPENLPSIGEIIHASSAQELSQWAQIQQEAEDPDWARKICTEHAFPLPPPHIFAPLQQAPNGKPWFQEVIREIKGSVPAPGKVRSNFLHRLQSWDSLHSDLMHVKGRHCFLPAAAAPLRAEVKIEVYPGYHPPWPSWLAPFCRAQPAPRVIILMDECPDSDSIAPHQTRS